VSTVLFHGRHGGLLYILVYYKTRLTWWIHDCW